MITLPTSSMKMDASWRNNRTPNANSPIGEYLGDLPYEHVMVLFYIYKHYIRHDPNSAIEPYDLALCPRKRTSCEFMIGKGYKLPNYIREFAKACTYIKNPMDTGVPRLSKRLRREAEDWLNNVPRQKYTFQEKLK